MARPAPVTVKTYRPVGRVYRRRVSRCGGSAFTLHHSAAFATLDSPGNQRWLEVGSLDPSRGSAVVIPLLHQVRHCWCNAVDWRRATTLAPLKVSVLLCSVRWCCLLRGYVPGTLGTCQARSSGSTSDRAIIPIIPPADERVRIGVRQYGNWIR